MGEPSETLDAASPRRRLPERSGIAKSTLTGMMAAELARDIGFGTLADFRDRAAPRRLPPAPLVHMAATARIRWREWRTGRDL